MTPIDDGTVHVRFHRQHRRGVCTPPFFTLWLFGFGVVGLSAVWFGGPDAMPLSLGGAACLALAAARVADPPADQEHSW